jgi:hypothetical protein
MSLIKVNQTKVAEQKAAEAQANRKTAYETEADPLFFKAQRGEIPLSDWLKKVEEIKQRYVID